MEEGPGVMLFRFLRMFFESAERQEHPLFDGF